MKIFTLFLISFFVLLHTVCAQSGMQLSQRFQNAGILNPAFTGVDNFMDIKAGYRHQWAGIPDGPQIYYLSITGVLVKPKYESIRSNALRISDPSLFSELGSNQFNRFSAIKHGVGANIFNDSYGPFNQLSAFVSYGFHFPITQKLRFTIGASGGIVNTRIDVSKVYVDEEFAAIDETYQAFLANGGGSTKLDVNSGFLLYSRKFYIGYSATNLMQNVLISNIGLEQERNAVAHSIMGGYKFQLGPDYQLLPSILMKAIDPFPGYYEYSVKMRYRKSFWSGLALRDNRDNRDMVLMTGFFLNNAMNISYSYDFSLNGFNDQLKGSHEVVIGLSIFNTSQALPYAW
jgi:type IX secretion system PorP/SprF family membrane protein